MVRQDIIGIVESALNSLQKQDVILASELPIIKIEYASDDKFGDYSTNIAFVLSKNEGKSPIDTAQVIAGEILKDNRAKEMFAKIETAGAGFINFTLSKKFLQNELTNVGSETSHIGAKDGQKLNIEFLSANPTGKFQVGNGRGAFYGDVLGNVLKLAGYEVSKEYYLNNAKSSNQIQELGKTALGEGEKYLTDYVQEKIEEIRPALEKCGGSDPAHMGEAGYLLAEEIHKDNKKFLEEKAGIKYDIWTEEEKLHNDGKLDRTLKILEEKDLVYEEEGALWLKTTQFGDDKNKVVVRSNGEYGYYLADIAYHLDKIQRGYKIIIDIFGADHQGHVEPMKIAMKIMEFEGRFDIIVTQLVQAKGGGRFSKRAGNTILLEELIEEVGVDVARFFYLMRSVDTQMEFDMDLAKDQSDKNPVYYVQYAHARMAGILRKVQDEGSELENNEVTEVSHKSELKLIKRLLRWPEIIEDTAKDYQIQRITLYASELATVFNAFYRDCKVIEDGKLIKSRLGIVISTKGVLKEVLGVLGIKSPDKM